ncbi:MAG: SRPBCC family protein [Sporichthyaceae bacterium]
MAQVIEHIDVAVPVSTAYNQWTQFESFPEFMDGVEAIRQIDDTHLHWQITVAGAKREFDATITEQHPDERVAWKSTDGTTHAGVITFHKLSEGTSRVTAQIDWEPEGLTEQAGAALGFDDRQVRGDLERFKEFIESRGRETGDWRGNVDNRD